MSEEHFDQEYLELQATEATTAEPALTQRLRHLIKLADEIGSLEDEIKSLKSDRDELAKVIDEDLAAAGMQHVRIDGKTVYRSLTLRASVPAENRDRVIESLRAMGLGDLVSVGVNAQTLSAQVREWNKELGVPAEIRDLIRIYEDRKVLVRN